MIGSTSAVPAYQPSQSHRSQVLPAFMQAAQPDSVGYAKSPLSGPVLQDQPVKGLGLNDPDRFARQATSAVSGLKAEADKGAALEAGTQTFRLSNGVTANLVTMPQRQQSAMSMVLPLTAEVGGVSNLLCSLLVDGSDATRRFINGLQDKDIQVSIDATPDKLLVSAHAPRGREADMAKGVFSLLANPQWNPEDFERLRQTTARNLEDFDRQPSTPLTTRITRMVYGQGQPYSYTPQESIGMLDGQTPDGMANALRQSMQALPLSVNTASSLPPSRQGKLLEDAIRESGWERNPFRPLSLPPVSASLSPETKSQVVLVPNDTLKRARIHLLVQSPPPGDPDYPAFLVLRNILGGHTAGSFFERLRTRDGLVYAVSSFPGLPVGNQGSFHSGIEVAFDQIDRGYRELLAVPQEAALKEMPPGVIETAKRRYLLGLRDNAQTASSTLDNAQPWLLRNLPPPSDKQMQAAIAQVGAPDILRVAKRMYANPNNLQIAGISAPAAVLRQTYGAVH